MAKLNLSQAAKVVNKSRVTIWRHIKSGKLSAERDRDGNPLVDTSELLRVYGEMKVIATPKTKTKQQLETPHYHDLLELIRDLKNEQFEMKEIILDLRNRIEHKPASASDEHDNVTNSKPEDDPEWPKEALSFADIAKREEIREKYNFPDNARKE
ncbi:MerR family transcriptional regulator [Shewanella sp. FeAMO]